MAQQKGLPLRAFAIFLLAAVVGVAGGLLGSGFQKGLDAIQNLLTGRDHLVDPQTGAYVLDANGDRILQTLPDAVREHLTPWQRLLVPTLGGLVAGLVLLLLRGRKPPFGLADLVVMVQLRKGALRLRETLVQMLSSACTIGSGGSIGREGANAHLAAMAATLVARWTRLGSRPRSVLIGCGIAAGMATSYNAPIAAAIFVMEVVLGNFAMDVCAPIVVASVLATIVRKRILEEHAVYSDSAAAVSAELAWTLILAAIVLGALCGVGGILFRGALHWGKRAFTALRMPIPLTMAAGGLVVGAIGIFMPETWGNGFDVIRVVADGNASLGVVLTLFFWKQIATVATVGSGGLGGIFTPNLVIGAAFGALFAHCVDWFTPLTAGETTAFVFVGMAGLTAATMHAPVTALVLVFELTGHYELTLPVMLCAIVASIVASLLDQDSYYTAAIRAKGEELPGGIEDLAMRATYVRDVQRTDTLTVRDAASFREVMELLGTHRGDTVYVQDAAGGLVGRIELQDVKNFLNDPTLTSVVIAADLTRSVVTVRADQSIAALMPLFDDPELREVAVVQGTAPPKLVGRVRHQDVLTTLGDEVLGQQRRSHRLALGGDELPLPTAHELRTIEVPDAWKGHAVDALPAANLHGAVVVMAIRPSGAGSEVVAATPDLVLQDGWHVVVLGTRDAIRKLRQDAPADDE
jgi:CIC family chloride channel protein